MTIFLLDFFFSSRRRHTRCALVTGVQTCALPISLAKGKRRVVAHLPTGGGKSLMAAKITEGARGKSNRVIFTVPAVSLIDQTVAAFEAEGLDGKLGRASCRESVCQYV